MDALSFALYIIYHHTYENRSTEALFKACILGGDCDSFGAVVGMMSGAIFGADDNLMK